MVYAFFVDDLQAEKPPRLLKVLILSREITSSSPMGEVDYVFQTSMPNFNMRFWNFIKTSSILGSISSRSRGNFCASVFSCDWSCCLVREGRAEVLVFATRRKIFLLVTWRINLLFRTLLGPILWEIAEKNQMKTLDTDFLSSTEHTMYRFFLSQTSVGFASMKDRSNNPHPLHSIKIMPLILMDVQVWQTTSP